MFKKIIDYNNLKQAYLEIEKQFAVNGKRYSYHGVDNKYLIDLGYQSAKLIKEIRQELILKSRLEPALSVLIPKKNKPNECREIYVFNLKERIKAQAIYQIILPHLEKEFSPRLFSYRPNKPPYLAARIYARHYRHMVKTDSVFILDLENFSNKINKQILLDKIKLIFPEKDMIDLLSLFIFNDFYRDGRRIADRLGILQGTPLTALFLNLYLTEFDYKYQAKVNSYLRVGDDIMMFDRSLSKLEHLKNEVLFDLKKLSVAVNKKKMFLGYMYKEHNYLGYNFNSGKIGLLSAQVDRILSDWQKILVYKNCNEQAKNKIFFNFLTKGENSFKNQFIKIITEKPQINNSDQIQKLSEDFFKIITRFFFKKYSERNRRLLVKKIKVYKIESLYQVYKKFHYEKH